MHYARHSSVAARSLLLAAVSLLAGLSPGSVAAPGALRAQAASAAQRAAPGELHFTILHTSDEHSAVLPAPLVDYRPGAADPTRGGFARLAGAVETLRARKTAAGEPVLLTSAGDNLGGTPFSWLALEGEAPELGLMVELGYDVVTLGNHEFDYGSDALARYLAAAGFPSASDRTALVATNTRPPDGHPLGELGIRRSHVVTLQNGLRVGFIGLLGEGAARFTTKAPPVEFDDAIEAAAAAVAELRAAGAHVVVAITHSGVEEDRSLARAVAGIDVILGGHDHRLLDEPAIEAGTLLVHPGAHLSQLVALELSYDPATGDVRARNAATGAPYIVPLDSTVGESAWMARRVAAYRDRLDRRVAELTTGRFAGTGATVVRSGFMVSAGPAGAESAFGDFITDAMRRAVERVTGEGVDVAFQANGVIRGDLLPGTAMGRQDEISVYDLAGPVGMGTGPDGEPGYPVVSLRLTGEEVRRALEVSILLSELLGDSYYLQVSGLRATYARNRAVLARIPISGTPIPTGRALLAVEWERDGSTAPLERGDTTLYHVVTDRYVASFLPMVGRLVPRLTVVPKDARGRAIDDLDAAIVRHDGRELKVWQAVLEYAVAQPLDAAGDRRIASRYREPAGRLVEVRAAPLWVWPAGIALLLALVSTATVLRRRNLRAMRATARRS